MHHSKAFLLVLAAAAIAVASCGDDERDGESRAVAAQPTGERILPIESNPIKNASTTPGLSITKALVENNVDPTTGKDAPDHLEIALANSTDEPLSGIEIYYEIIDETRNVSEGYYAKLNGFTIEPGKTRVAHFDDTGEKDHFPVNPYSLYYTDQNELLVEITASAPDLEPATFSVRKDAASAEAGVEQD